MLKQVLKNIFLKNNLIVNKNIKVSSLVNFSVKKFSTINDDYENALKKVKNLKEEPGNEDKLELYGLFKQITEGPNKTPKPGAFDIAGKYKWQAWFKVGNISKEEAIKIYINKVNELAQKYGLNNEGSSNIESVKEENPLLISVDNSVKTIKFNRPKKLNAFTVDIYKQITDELNNSSKDDSIKAVILTGSGSYYSAGNDLTIFKNASKDFDAFAKEAGSIMVNFVDAHIDFEKPLISVVNGPAVGISATTLGLCDLVICTNDATFSTPFGSTAQTPEGLSTYTFPKIMGTSMANQMLLFNYKMTAQEALMYGLVGRVVDKNDLESTIENLKKNISENCSSYSLIWGKKLMRTDEIKEKMKKINRIESERLQKSWQSPDFPKFIGKFFQKK